jgi:hypothetical protein
VAYGLMSNKSAIKAHNGFTLCLLNGKPFTARTFILFWGKPNYWNFWK